VYKGHFEKCKDGSGYQFTKDGLVHALEYGVPKILGESLKSEHDLANDEQ
jgi:hypothetical protein